MKNKLQIISVAIVSFLLALTFSCKKEVPKIIPSISTTAPTNITSTTANSGGTISADGGAPVTSRGVCWSAIQNPTTSDNKTSDGTGVGGFTSSILDLSPGATYYLRAYATNSVGTAYGNQTTITTIGSIPTVTTTELLEINSTTATGGGNITSDGGVAVISRGVCWSSSQNPTTSNSKTENGIGSGIFSSSITGLTPGLTYYIRAYATNIIGTSYGNQLSFTTPAIIPTLTTTAITDIGASYAKSGGSITSDGGATIISRGVCWSTNQTPTIENSKTVETSGSSIFTSSIIGLNLNTTYYVRAYATNNAGTGYGNTVSFKTIEAGTVSDIDGNVYHILTIGTQEWLAENLKTTKYSNGDLIGTTTPATLDIQAESRAKYQWAYAGNESNVDTYGRLYTWHAATDSRNICPTGWRIPTYTDWGQLVVFLGGESIAGSILKESGTTHWNTPNIATNNSGFTALPAGYRAINGPFYFVGKSCCWWSSTGHYSLIVDSVWVWTLNNDSSEVLKGNAQKNYGFSVRCIKDN